MGDTEATWSSGRAWVRGVGLGSTGGDARPAAVAALAYAGGRIHHHAVHKLLLRDCGRREPVVGIGAAMQCETDYVRARRGARETSLPVLMAYAPSRTPVDEKDQQDPHEP